MSVFAIFYRCERCFAVFAVGCDEKCGGHYARELLEANPCPVCRKGSVEKLGEQELD